MTTLNGVNIESGKVEVEIFTQTDAALAHLREKYAVVPSTETDEGYAFVKAGVKELTGYRTKLDAERQRIKKPFLDAGRIIDAEAKRITATLVELEEPLKAAKQEADEREKRKQEERIARLQQKVDAIAAHVQRAKGKSSAEIAQLIEQVDAIVIDDFFDLTSEATRVRNETLDALGELYSAQLGTEQAEAERAKARALQEQAEAAQRELERKAHIEQRLTTLRMIPVELMGKPAAAVRAKITLLTNYPPIATEFGERAEEAQQAHQQVIAQLEMLASQAETLEALAASQAPAAEPEPTTEQGPTVTEQSDPVMDDPSDLKMVKAAFPDKEPTNLDTTFPGNEPEAEPEMVTIPRAEYQRLLHDSELLDALKAAGVDNWSGYSDAMAMYRAA